MKMKRFTQRGGDTACCKVMSASAPAPPGPGQLPRGPACGSVGPFHCLHPHYKEGVLAQLWVLSLVLHSHRMPDCWPLGSDHLEHPEVVGEYRGLGVYVGAVTLSWFLSRAPRCGTLSREKLGQNWSRDLGAWYGVGESWVPSRREAQRHRQ